MKINRISKTDAPKQQGFSLVEMIIYIAILTLLTSVLVTSAVSLLSTFVYMRAGEEIAQSGVISLERITRETRTANAVLTAQSTLDSSPGVLALDTVDVAGNPTTVTFRLTSGRITIQQGTTAATPLTPGNVTISNLVFHQVDGTNTDAVRTSFTATRNVRGVTVSKEYRAFTVLDGL